MWGSQTEKRCVKFIRRQSIGDNMQSEELKKVFDQQASGYDKQSAKIAPIHDGLHFLL